MRHFYFLLLTLFLSGWAGSLAASVDESEPNNELSAANFVPLGESVIGSLDKDDSRDCFQIQIPAEGELVISVHAQTTLKLGWMYFCIRNSEGDFASRISKYMNAEGKDSTIYFTISDLKAGAYYIEVNRSTGNGSYRLTPSFKENSLKNDREPNDGDSTAVVLKPDTTVTGRLGYSYFNDTDNRDCYKLYIPTEGELAISTHAQHMLTLGWMYFCVRNAEGKYTSRNSKYMNADGKDSTVVFTIRDLKAGTYYIEVNRSSGYGGYKLATSFKPNEYINDQEPNETYEDAGYFGAEVGTTGRLGYNYHNNVDNVDWHRFELLSIGDMTMRIHCEKTLGLGWMYLHRENETGKLKNFNSKYLNVEGKDSTVVFTFREWGPGTYYIELNRSWGYGGYTISTSFTGVTGIETITSDADKPRIYDLNGRAVEQMGKGFYIINGKKVLVK